MLSHVVRNDLKKSASGQNRVQSSLGRECRTAASEAQAEV